MKKKIISMIYGILALAVGLTACAKEETVYLEQIQEATERTETAAPDISKEPAFCCVYVCGAVHNPGVFELAVDARVCDAVEAAGGFTEDAQQSAINLAERIYDAEQIYIPTVGEAGTTSGMAGGSGAVSEDDGKVNLNTATKEELMTIPGIGESKATDIITYREQSGGFTDISDIMKIAGIKEGIFEKIKDCIKVN